MSFLKKDIQTNLTWLLYILLAFFFPLSQSFSTIPIVFLLLSWIYEGNIKSRLQTVINNPLVLILISTYIISIIGTLYSTNIKKALFELELNVSILIFPVIFSTTKNTMVQQQSRTILIAFILGCITAFIICSGNSLYLFYQTHNLEVFYYKSLAIIHTPGSLSMYINLGIILLLFDLLKINKLSDTYNFRIIKVLILSAFIGFVILLASKTSILFLIIILFSTTVYLFYKIKSLTIKLILVLSTCLIIFTSFFTLSFTRFKNAFNTIDNTSLSKNSIESTALRISAFHASMDIIKENWFWGVGTGDVKDELIKKYQEEKYLGALKLKTSPHNQFLKSYLKNGLLGFTALLITLIIPLAWSITKKKYLIVFFLLNILFNTVTDDLFDIQSGAVFYSFFNSFFLFIYPKLE